MTRVRAYLRESTAAQGEKFGPDAQRAAITDACRVLDLPPPARWYTDLVSGTGRVVRDDLGAALADAQAHDYDVLVCYDTSRFARNERDAFNFEHELHRAGARLFYVREGIWADDRRSAVHKGVMHVLAAQYSRDLSERIRDGLRAKKAKGGWVGGVPWGYRYSADLMRIEPTDDATVRLLAWDLYASGAFTTATLAEELNRRGLRIRSRGADRPFTKWTLTEFFRSRVDREVGGLDPATYDRARAIMDARRTTHEKPGQRRHAYVFSGVARCGDCGEAFWGRMHVDRAKPASRAQLYHAPSGCRKGAHYEDAVEAWFGRWLQTWRLPADARTRIARYVGRGQRDDGRAVRRHAIAGAIERLRDLYRWGEIDERGFTAERARLQRELDELGPDATTLVPSGSALKLASEIGTAWNAVSAETRRRFVSEWFEQVMIRRDGSVEVYPRPAYASIVFAAVGGHGGHGTSTAHHADPHAFTVAGYAAWAAFWASEATA